MGFWAEKWGITEEEWGRILAYYADLGGRLAPDKEVLTRFEELVNGRRIEAALHLLCYHYSTPPVSVVRKGMDGLLVFGVYLPAEREIILYDRAFEDPQILLFTILHEFAHHLQHTKYPFWLHDERLRRIHEEAPRRTSALTQKFAGRFATTAVGRLGYEVEWEEEEEEEEEDWFTRKRRY